MEESKIIVEGDNNHKQKLLIVLEDNNKNKSGN